MDGPLNPNKNQKEIENKEISEIKTKSYNENIFLYNPDSSNEYSINSNWCSMSDKEYSNSNNLNKFIVEEKKENENKFNSFRADFYMKNKLYEIVLYPKINNFLPKYKIKGIYFSFLYPNEIVTYPVCISGFIFRQKNKINIQPSISSKENINIYNKNVGLCFCDKSKEIKIEKEIKKKKCTPNEFM